MKLSTRARYALRMMIEIARGGDEGSTTSLAEVARKTSLSRRYLDQLAAALRQAALIEGVVGKGGGYSLTRPAGQISLGDIITASIGPISIVDCVEAPEGCLKSEICECRPIYQLINHRITELLDEISLAEAAAGQVTRNYRYELADDTW